MHELFFRIAYQQPDLALFKGHYAESKFAIIERIFAENINRVTGLLIMPGYVFVNGGDWRACETGVAKRLFGDRLPTDEEFEENKRFMENIAVQAKLHLDENRTQEQFDEQFKCACRNIDVFAHQSAELHRSIHDLYKSAIIQAWGAFEVLAEDLWKDAVSLRPHLDARTKDEKQKSGHRSRSKIANLYRWTFRLDNSAMLRPLESTAVTALAVVRNVLVHSAGLVDEDFIRDRKGISELNCITQYDKDEEILFSGLVVRNLIDPVIPLGFELVKAVDAWFTTHP